MIATPNLPPLPTGITLVFSCEQMRDYALAAYAAGRDAGLEDAIQQSKRSAQNYFPEFPEASGACVHLGETLLLMKSKAKGGV